MIRYLVNIFLVSLSGISLILIFSGFDLHYLAWIALLPLVLLLRQSGLLKAGLYSLSTGVIFYGGLLWWTLKIDGVNPFNFSLVVLGNASYFGLFGLLAYYFQKKNPRWNILTFPASWVLLEYLRSHVGFLSFTWGILGYSQYNVLPIARISVFTGVYGVSFVIVAVNTILAEMIRPYIFSSKSKKNGDVILTQRCNKISFGFLAGIVILIIISSLYESLYSIGKVRLPDLRVALIQGNVYYEEKHDLQLRERVFQTYYTLTLKASQSVPDLIAWPSSSVPGMIPYDMVLVDRLSSLARETGKFLLIGSSGYDKFSAGPKKEKKVSNSAFLISPQGKFIGRYDKINLLPFDEYIPLRDYVKWPSSIVSPAMADSKAGEEMTLFNTGEYKFRVLICWENMFSDQFRMMAKGADFMVSMTNEGFTDSPAAHYQMLAMNIFRAIENHISIIRTSTIGVSAIIEPTGAIVAKVQDQNSKDVNVEGYAVGQIPLTSNRTFYNRYGDWFIYTLFITLTGFILRRSKK